VKSRAYPVQPYFESGFPFGEHQWSDTGIFDFLRRDPLEAAGFTSEDLDGQLLSLGEYLCMYIMVWSDVLWPADMPISASSRPSSRDSLPTGYDRPLACASSTGLPSTEADRSMET
jgi:hypothetical protein